MGNKKTYVLILNYVVWQDTIECLESVLKSGESNFQIVIIDNCSPNDSEVYLKKWLHGQLDAFVPELFFREKILPPSPRPLPHVVYPVVDHRMACKDKELESSVLDDWTKKRPDLARDYSSNYPILFVQTGENLGFAGGNNLVLRFLLESDCDADVFLLNPDVFLESNALELLRQYNSSEREFICGMSVYDYRCPDRLNSIGGTRLLLPFGIVKDVVDYGEIDKLDYIYGGALYSNLTTFRKVGLLPEEYFLFWEETEWCYRARLLHVPLRICRPAVCYDKVGSSIGRGYFAEYYFTYNMLKFYKKNFPSYRFLVFMAQCFRLLVKLIKRKGDHALAIGNAISHYMRGKSPNAKRKDFC